ncbi:large ribosomal subunit protein uL18m isoform X1 [Macrotis lagotis]|uniref:large ribosomal subunit protein uL18m isoform X1 n=1 Tax=Macrotis lagotis TaxID=92651 RepID=UPI003D6827F4
MAHASTLLVREAARARPGSPVLEPRRSRGSLLIGRGKRPSLFWPVPRALFGRCACALFPTRSVPDQDGRARATFAAPLTCAEPSLQPLPGGRRPDGAAGGGPGPVGSVQEARLRVHRTQHHVEAFVECHNGDVVVSASTQEWAIKKHLYRTRSVNACENIGRVLAQRCLEAGINFMVFYPTPWESSSESIQRLQNAMKEGGVVLQEPRRIYE